MMASSSPAIRSPDNQKQPASVDSRTARRHGPTVAPGPKDRDESVSQPDVAAVQRSAEGPGGLLDPCRQVGAGEVPGPRASATRQRPGRTASQASREDFAKHRRAGRVDGEYDDSRPGEGLRPARACRRDVPDPERRTGGTRPCGPQGRTSTSVRGPVAGQRRRRRRSPGEGVGCRGSALA
jgi:hypothetical protein